MPISARASSSRVRRGSPGGAERERLGQRHMGVELQPILAAAGQRRAAGGDALGIDRDAVAPVAVLGAGDCGGQVAQRQRRLAGDVEQLRLGIGAQQRLAVAHKAGAQPLRADLVARAVAGQALALGEGHDDVVAVVNHLQHLQERRLPDRFCLGIGQHQPGEGGVEPVREAAHRQILEGGLPAVFAPVLEPRLDGAALHPGRPAPVGRPGQRRRDHQ